MSDNSALSDVRDSLVTARDSLTDVRMSTPLDTIVRNGQARRTRHKLTGLTAATAVTVGAAASVAVLLPASDHGGHSATARLTAWTVARQSNGNIDVTIRELRDPAGLQRNLRADGVPASVTFLRQPNRSCRPYPATRKLARSVFPNPPLSAGPGLKIVINPSALPSDGGVRIGAKSFPHPEHRVSHGVLHVGPSFASYYGLVRASKPCTGS